MATITRGDRTSVQVVVSVEGKEALDSMAAELSSSGQFVTASDVMRMALAEYFEKRGKTVQFAIQRGGKREKKK